MEMKLYACGLKFQEKTKAALFLFAFYFYDLFAQLIANL